MLRSVGGGVRGNVMGLIAEASMVRALDLQQRGWRFAFNLRPGF